MKKTIVLIATATVLTISAFSQAGGQLEAAVAKLDQANSVKEYEQLSGEFLQIAGSEKDQWLPYYYSAFCNAEISWLIKEDDPDNIEKFAGKADDQIKKARALLDTATQKKEISEVYCVLSMLNRAMVYINPATYGRKYGMAAMQYTQLARTTNPDNPRALYIEGWEKYATPKLYGGDKKKAKELLLSAQQKLTGETSGVQPHWGKKDVAELLDKIK